MMSVFFEKWSTTGLNQVVSVSAILISLYPHHFLDRSVA